MALNLLVYDPPIAGFPYLAVAIETEAPAEVLYAEAHPTLAEAEAAIVRMAARMERDGLPEAGLPEAGLPEGGLPEGGLQDGGVSNRGVSDGGVSREG